MVKTLSGLVHKPSTFPNLVCTSCIQFYCVSLVTRLSPDLLPISVTVCRFQWPITPHPPAKHCERRDSWLMLAEIWLTHDFILRKKQLSTSALAKLSWPDCAHRATDPAGFASRTEFCFMTGSNLRGGWRPSPEAVSAFQNYLPAVHHSRVGRDDLPRISRVLR